MFVNDKSCVTAKGPFLTLHKLKGKLYAEVPLETIGRDAHRFDHLPKPATPIWEPSATNRKDPIHVKFTRIDTTLYLSEAPVPPLYDKNDPHMAKGLSAAVRCLPSSRRSVSSATTATVRRWSSI